MSFALTRFIRLDGCTNHTTFHLNSFQCSEITTMDSSKNSHKQQKW